MTFFDQSIYNKMFHQVVHKGKESAINYNKRNYNAKNLEISPNEYHLKHTFADNFHQGVNYSAQISSHHVELRREEKSIDKKLLSISDLQIDYLNLDNLVRNNRRGGNSQSG